MLVVKKSSNGVQNLSMDSVLLSQRKIFITGEINQESANDVLKQLLFLESESNTEPIDIIINSQGGAVDSGMAIYDQIKGMQNIPINIYCWGLCASMAAILLAGGQKGRRFVLPRSKIMIHEPLLAGGVGGSATSIQRTAESIMKTKRDISELLAADTGKTVEEIEKAIAYDHFMSAQEAVEFGLCDKIVMRV